MKIFNPTAEAGPSLADASAELAAEMRRVARAGGREVLAYLDELLTADELAKFLKVEVQSTYRWASEGCGPRRVKIGGGDGPVRYRRADLLRWLGERTVQPAKAPPRHYRTRSRHQVATAEGLAS